MKRLAVAGLLLLTLGARRAIAQVAAGVYVGKTVIVNQPVVGRIVVVGGALQISAPISGDVVGWGSGIRMLEGGSIRGRLVMFGGSFLGSSSAISGGMLTPGSLAAVYLAEARRSPLARPPAGERATLLALRLCVLAIWLLLSMAVLRWTPTALMRAAIAGETDPGRAALAGLLTLLLLFAGAVAALAALPPFLRLGVTAAVLCLAVALKIFGMSALFLMVGQRALARLSPGFRPAALATGLAILGAISIVPLLGPLVWSAASIYGVGIATLTRFGAPRFRIAVA